MITSPTRKLYFKKYLTCLKFNISLDRSNSVVSKSPILMEIKNHLKAHNIDYKSRLDWFFTRTSIEVKFAVYLNDEQACDYFINNYPTYLSHLTTPLSNEHKELIKSKIEIEIRDKLIYNRFKYKVLFKTTGRMYEKKQEIKDWISTAFETKVNSRKGDYLLVDHWLLTLYLTTKEDLTLVRLCLSDNITSIIQVDTVDEHKQ